MLNGGFASGSTFFTRCLRFVVFAGLRRGLFSPVRAVGPFSARCAGSSRFCVVRRLRLPVVSDQAVACPLFPGVRAGQKPRLSLHCCPILRFLFFAAGKRGSARLNIITLANRQNDGAWFFLLVRSANGRFVQTSGGSDERPYFWRRRHPHDLRI